MVLLGGKSICLWALWFCTDPQRHSVWNLLVSYYCVATTTSLYCLSLTANRISASSLMKTFILLNLPEPVFALMPCLSWQMSAVGGPNLLWSWVFAIGVLGISILGIFAGCSEKLLALKIVGRKARLAGWVRRIKSWPWFYVQFAGFMVAGMVIMMIFGIVVVVMRNKVIFIFLLSPPSFCCDLKHRLYGRYVNSGFQLM